MKTKLIALFILLVIGFIYTAFGIHSYSKVFFKTSENVAVVLGAGTHHGKLSKVYEQRVLHAIYLLDHKCVEKIIFTGGYGENQTISDSKAVANYALQRGVLPLQILIEESSTITFQNIKNTKTIMENNQLKSALLVSDPYHMKRAMHMCNLIGVNAYPSPTPTTMYKSYKTKLPFLIRETFFYWAYLLVGQHRSLE